MVYVPKHLKLLLDNTKREIDNHPNWMFCVKNQFEYERISSFDKKQRASRAFYKIMEIFRKTKLVDTIYTKKALCLCEAPGGFIQGIQEISPNTKIFAQSIKSNIKFNNKIDPNIYEYSDLSNLETILRYAKDCKINGKYQLITGDGGIDVSDDYSQQETKNLKVIYCQILTMLYCLDIGGNFIVKIFDTFTEETVKLLQLLSNLFEHFEIMKPVLSRPCNSEKYVICKGFLGYTKPIQGFANQINNELITFENIKITNDFRNQIVAMNTTFVSSQIRCINEILDICKGKYNYKNINSRRNQISKSMNMYKNLCL